MTEPQTTEKVSKMGSRRGLIVFLVGLGLGVGATIVGQQLVGDRLPSAVSGGRESVAGRVAAKQRHNDRLLLTIVTPAGAILGTFTKQLDEIDLLVNVGDTVELTIPSYRPFLDDPKITRVSPGGEARAAEPATMPDSAGLQPDSVQTSDSTANESASRWY